MSRYLPPELLDLIADHLHDEPVTLKLCCVVSTSWVPRARRHLFAHIEFGGPGSLIDSWMKAFPNPSNSPAHHTHTLWFSDLTSIIAASTYARAWVNSFHRVVKSEVKTHWPESFCISLAQFNGSLPSLRSLRLSRTSIPLSEALDLICSFPLLEDVRLDGVVTESGTDQWHPPPASPRFTGCLCLNEQSHSVARGLLGLPGGLRFSKISVFSSSGDAGSIAELVLRCSDTLESFTIHHYPMGARVPPPLDLSKAMKLKEAEFHWITLDVQWIITTLRTAKSNNLQKIDIWLGVNFPATVTETLRREWQDLDRLLVELWTSRLIRPMVEVMSMSEGYDPERFTPILLPELTARGAVEVI